MPSESEIRRAYQAVHPKRTQAAATLERLLGAIVAEANVHDISARAKAVDSFCVKAAKTKNGSPKYTDPLAEITDQVAARVITYLPATVNDVCTALDAEFEIVEDEDKGEAMKRQGKFGYASRHLLLRLKGDRQAQPEYACLAGLEFEVQVRTVVQHAWAEFEHDVRYKYAIPADRKPAFDRAFTLAAALIELADEQFTEIDDLYNDLAKATPDKHAEPLPESDRLKRSKPSTKDSAQSPVASKPAELVEPAKRDEDSQAVAVPIDADALPAILAKRYPDAIRSRRNHYELMVRTLAALDIKTVDALDRALAGVDSDAVAAVMQHQLPAGHIRRLEDDLLSAFGRRYITACQIDAFGGRDDVLNKRLRKLRPPPRAERGRHV